MHKTGKSYRRAFGLTAAASYSSFVSILLCQNNFIRKVDA